MVYLPTKLGHFWGFYVGIYIPAPFCSHVGPMIPGPHSWPRLVKELDALVILKSSVTEATEATFWPLHLIKISRSIIYIYIIYIYVYNM